MENVVAMDPGIVLGKNWAALTPEEVEYVYTVPLTVAVRMPFLAEYIGLVVQSLVIRPFPLT